MLSGDVTPDLVRGIVGAVVFAAGLALGAWRWRERDPGESTDNGLD
jgi:hypothetical protein